MKDGISDNGQRRARLVDLHSWLGLLSCWVLFVAFFCGTLALYDAEITEWMQPEIHLTDMQAPTESALAAVTQRLHAAETHGGALPFLILPNARAPAMRLVHYDGHSFQGPVLDPTDGHEILARATEGGLFFFDFHYTLRLGQIPGAACVALAGFGFLILLLSGLLIHLRRLLPDLFKLRIKAPRPRFWLDAHVMTGVFGLPFHLILTVTGIILLGDLALPMRAPPAPAPQAAPNGPATPAIPLGRLIHTAEAVPGAGRARYVLFAPGVTTVYTEHAGALAEDSTALRLNSQTGALLPTAPAGGADRAASLIYGLHMVRPVGPVLRLVWFIGGSIGTLLIASGLLYYEARSSRRALDRRRTAAMARGNVAIIAGLMLACLAYFWLNRLLPAHWAGRAQAEVSGFFLAWLATVLFTALRPMPCVPARLWCWPLRLCGATSLTLGLYDALRFWPGRHDLSMPVFITVDVALMVIGTGILLAQHHRARRANGTLSAT